jgi:hypothetical protein
MVLPSYRIYTTNICKVFPGQTEYLSENMGPHFLLMSFALVCVPPEYKIIFTLIKVYPESVGSFYMI